MLKEPPLKQAYLGLILLNSMSKLNTMTTQTPLKSCHRTSQKILLSMIVMLGADYSIVKAGYRLIIGVYQVWR